MMSVPVSLGKFGAYGGPDVSGHPEPGEPPGEEEPGPVGERVLMPDVVCGTGEGEVRREAHAGPETRVSEPAVTGAHDETHH